MEHTYGFLLTLASRKTALDAVHTCVHGVQTGAMLTTSVQIMLLHKLLTLKPPCQGCIKTNNLIYLHADM